MFLLAAVLSGPLAIPASAAVQAAPVRLLADLACTEHGGAEVTFTVRNLGRETLEIDPDFHLSLSAVRPGGPELIGIVFVFPAPGFDVIAPGGESTFIVPIAAAEPGEPGATLQGRRLLLEAEVFLAGREHPARRIFSFPGCP